MFTPRSKNSVPVLRRLRPALICGVILASCRGDPDPETLESRLRTRAASSGAEVGLVYRVLDGRDSGLVNPDLRMHAASTMKVPVMLQLFLDHQAGRLDLDESILVTTTFRSILDGSPYEIDPASDSDSTLYARVAEEVSRPAMGEPRFFVS